MSLFDYQASKEISATDPPFYALVMAAIRQADTDNAERLREAFPATHAELVARYNAPGGVLDSDRPSVDSSHCIRCGVEYDTPTLPRCECAGDPPVDKQSIDYQGWLNTVRQLRYDRSAAVLS